MNNLNGKHILMFSPYGATKHYGEAIRTELESRGAIVKEYDERPSQKALTKIILRLFNKNIPQIFNVYIKNVINQNKDLKFNYILICRGEAFTPFSIKHLKSSFPDAKIILYLWDILKTTNVANNISYCDKAMSFDPEDVYSNENLEFRPTFFINEFKNVIDNPNPSKDIVFIGTLHSNRNRIITNIKDKLSIQGINMFTYLYVPSRIVYVKDYIIKYPYININKVNFKPMSILNIIQVLNNAKAVLDINYSNQKSLSMRAYEAMAARRKYITTNPEIKKYDFYNPNNILVIDINNPIVPRDFLETPYEIVNDEILKNYSVSKLVEDLFNINSIKNTNNM